MDSKDIAFIFGVFFAGIFLVAVTILIAPEGGEALISINGRAISICLVAAGGIIISFTPLILGMIKKRKEAKGA